MARSGASDIDLKPRLINIRYVEMLSWEPPFLTVRLDVSKGTYVRAFARDLGHMCNSSAYVKALYRTKIGPFDVRDAVRHDDQSALEEADEGRRFLEMLPGCMNIEVNDIEAFKASNGYVKNSVRERIPSGCSLSVLMHGGNPVCVYSVGEGRIICQVHHDS
jgi:tRNA U55 pseudouridine synthase TruB